MNRRGWISSTVLLLAILGIAGGLTAWKHAAQSRASAAAANQPEPMEAVTAVSARESTYRASTTAVGTVLALRWITLSNELAGTVHEVHLAPGQIVEEGTLLVALDVSVEQAELAAQEAQVRLAEATVGRMERASQNHAASEMDLDRARSERDVAQAQVERTQAIIAQKTLRAPFRARVGLGDVHVGQYLNQGTEITTLQGVDDAVHVDFSVAQQVAAGLHEGERVDVLAGGSEQPLAATIVAIDARVDPATRNALVRARIEGSEGLPAPGASVRVQVPTGAERVAVAIPASALRKGPDGDHVFVIEPDAAGKSRAHLRRVEAGAMLGDEVLILSGLQPGESVAALGSFKLREGVLVAVTGGSVPQHVAGSAPQPGEGQ